MPLIHTIGNAAWREQNADKLKAILPETWTHMRNLNMLQIGFNLKVLGVDWRGDQELAHCMILMERAGLMVRDAMLVKRA